VLRGPVNERRLKLILQAFAILDKDQSGVITVEDLARGYSVDQHPKV